MLSFFRKKMKVILIIVAVVFVGSMFYGFSFSFKGANTPSSSSDLVKINGHTIDPLRYREIFNRLVNQFGSNVSLRELPFLQNLTLDQTIDFSLILDQAKRNVRISNKEVDLAINNIMQQQKIASKKQLEAALKQVGLTLNQFKQMIKDEMLVQKMVNKVRADVKVTPNDLREIKASHILVSDEATAKDLLIRVNKGESFAVLAKKYSQDPGSAAKGGDLGYFVTGRMIEPFEQAAFAAKVGEVTPLVKSPYGFHIIKVTDSRLRTFSGKGKDLDQAALAEKQDLAFRKWLTGYKQKAKIEIISPELKAGRARFNGQLFEAAQLYKQAISQNPTNSYLHIFLADTYLSLGKPDLALPEYELAISMQGGNPEFYMILAQVYEKQGDTKNAISQYKKASIVAGENKELRDQLKKKFKELGATAEYQAEQAEIAKIIKKEKFEADLKK